MSDFSTKGETRPSRADQDAGARQEPPGSAMEAVTRRFMRYLGNDGAPLTGIWGIICLFNLGVMAVSAAIQYRTGVMPLDPEMFQDPDALRQFSQQAQTVNFAALLNIPLTVLAVAMYASGFRPMRVIERQGAAHLSFGELRSEMFSNFGTTALVTFLYLFMVGLGAACCLLPGLIAGFLFLPAPYIASAMGSGVFASLSESLRWVKRHWLLLAVAVSVSLLMAAFIVIAQVVAGPVFVGMFGKTGILLTSGLVWLLGVIIGYFGWMFSGAVYITIDLAEERYKSW